MGRVPLKMHKMRRDADFQPAPPSIEPNGDILRIAIAAFVLLMFILYGCHAKAQALPDAPQPKTPPVHSFMDTTNVSNFFATVSAVSAEVGQACNTDNIGRRSCNQLQLAGAAYVSGSVLAAAVLHKTGHHSLERMLPLTVTLLHVARITYVSMNRSVR